MSRFASTRPTSRIHRLGLAALLVVATIGLRPAFAQDEGGDAEATPPPPARTVSTVDEARALVVDPTATAEELKTAIVPLTAADLAPAVEARLAGYQAALASGEGISDARARLKTVIAAYEDRGGDVGLSDPIEVFITKTGGEGVKTPATAEEAAEQAAQWIQDLETWATSADGGVKVGVGILSFLAILLIAKIVSSIASRIVRRALGKMGKGSELLRDFLANITRQVIFLVGLVVAIGQLGVETGPLLAAVGAAGFVIGFALQDTLGNFAAGVMILLYRPYDVGDVVTAGGETGKVEAMTLVSTTLVTPDNRVIIVPNGSIWGGTITNVTDRDIRRVDLVCGCGYDDDFEKAAKILREILESHPLVLQDPAPAVVMGALADSSVNFNVRPWAKTADYWTVFSEVQEEVKRRFDAEGIGIPFPQMDVHVHQVAAT